MYILASTSRVLYTGMTNDIGRRLAEHRAGQGSTFAKRYRATRLVHLEEHPTAADAIRREKEIKAWRREKRVRLIEASNPEWADLSGQS
ncbi:GIY-YIG nuclease family protein [Rubrivirga sp. IMCC45206]|uniref:GIY-YIG nuclease family protein n=1 Tax=Rubrivirga sp. IMCC45206 TaxID=3391614 RepID=UPI00398FA49F